MQVENVFIRTCTDYLSSEYTREYCHSILSFYFSGLKDDTRRLKNLLIEIKFIKRHV